VWIETLIIASNHERSGLRAKSLPRSSVYLLGLALAGVEDLAALLAPDRAVSGQRYGLELDAHDQAALLESGAGSDGRGDVTCDSAPGVRGVPVHLDGTRRQTPVNFA
jgi:hypothetical protein